ncbi:MAG TPA: trehalase family glycosidase [Candidatus Saccharimonadales bacterium]|nr:trehalase family glycosidase [Candidatus Saccharimonadales bacterium]
MNNEAAAELIDKAAKVLRHNDRRGWTVPAGDLYPHQWFWDSCFVAIGLRHIDIERAQTELKSLLGGQWHNGMFPNIIFSNDRQYWRDRQLWRSWINPYAPDDTSTSGITQPPMLAEAVVQIGEKLKLPERRSWYRQMLGPLVRYHEWLYLDRDPHKEGLILLLHPYESGFDSSPPWLSELRKHSVPWWLGLVERAHLDWTISFARHDTKYVDVAQRSGNIEAAAAWVAIHRLRRKAYNSEALISRSLFAVEDLTFNCILIQANKCLVKIAKTLNHQLSPDLLANMKRTEAALEQLWDEDSGHYYCRSFASHKLIQEPTIATLLPLYSGTITKERAERLVGLLKRRRMFSPNWPVPSVPVNSPDFNPYKYWQGPTWVNTNWLIIQGLSNYGFHTEAAKLRDQTIKLAAKSGFSEYFNPLNAAPLGAANFSWTAALVIDLLKD